MPALALGIIGVVVIALIIMGLKSLFTPKDGGQEQNSILNSEISIAPTAAPTATPSPSLAPAKEADITGKEIIQLGDVVIVGDAAYDYYKFNKDKADRFVAAVNKSAGELGDGVNSSIMLIPGAVDIMLPLSFLDENSDKTSDQEKAIKYLNKGLEAKLKPIELYPILKAHCNEKLYYKSDTRWTSLGAYYGYSQWASNQGFTPKDLKEYEKLSAENFLGNQYTYTAHSAISTPEIIEYYKPAAGLSMEYGEEKGLSPFKDVSEEDSDGKYNVFLGGSRGLTKLVNAGITDGSSCILVADSNGNSIAPYIAEHFQYTYMVDYRKYENKLSELVSETGAKNVSYCISITASSSDSLTENLEGL